MDSLEPSPSRRRMGGSYSSYTAGGRAGTMIALQTDGDLVDSSGRRIKTSTYSNGGTNIMDVGGLADQPRQ